MLITALLVVLAHTSGKVEKVCPLDGTKFTATVDFSGTSFGKQLDLRPIGPTPAPWAIPVCPKDHFPLFKREFSAAEIASLRAFVKTPEYQALSRETSYYLTAKVMQHLEAPALDVAHVLLKATWQVAGEPRYAKYAGDALAAFKAAIAQLKDRGDDWQTAQVAALELERRTERFDDATRRIASLETEKALAPQVAAIVQQQKELVAKRDTAPHDITAAP